MNENGYYVSCVTGVKGVTGITHFSQEQKFDIPFGLGHEVKVVDKDQNKQHKVAAVAHIKY